MEQGTRYLSPCPLFDEILKATKKDALIDLGMEYINNRVGGK